MPLRFDAPFTFEEISSVLRYAPAEGHFYWLSGRCAGKRAGSVGEHGRSIKYRGVALKEHRLAWLFMIGEWPMFTVDHRDLDSRNNVWTNIRKASSSQNNANKKKRGASEFKGVVAKGSRFQARLGSGASRSLGVFDTPREAAMAYDKAAKAQYGEFAVTNL